MKSCWFVLGRGATFEGLLGVETELSLSHHVGIILLLVLQPVKMEPRACFGEQVV